MTGAVVVLGLLRSARMAIPLLQGLVLQHHHRTMLKKRQKVAWLVATLQPQLEETRAHTHLLVGTRVVAATNAAARDITSNNRLINLW